MAIMAVLVLASCAGNVFEQKTKVFNKATEKVSAVQNVDEVEAIIISVEDEINAIEQGEEWKAYEALVYSADGCRVYNPTLQTIWFDDDGKMYCIKPGETIVIE